MKNNTNKIETKNGITIKLGIDAHAKSYWVSRQIDGASPQAAQKLDRAGLLKWATKQVESGATVHSCYEAGPFGYWLHRKLEKLGVKNVIVQPQKLDERNKGVKNDKFDAKMLAQRLDRYVSGNQYALATVRVPTEAEEQIRNKVRQCEQVKRLRRTVMLQGHGLLIRSGYTENKGWWEPHKWLELCQELPQHLIEQLGIYGRIITKLTEEEEALKKVIEANAPRQLPCGVGCYTFTLLHSEVGNWHRFTNRQQVGSYTGLCPREHSSGNSQRMGSISKHGNPYVRAALIELSWRLLVWQPNYRGTKIYIKRCPEGKTTSAMRKKAIVAMARELAIDLWRLFTGRTTPEVLGLILKEHKSQPENKNSIYLEETEHVRSSA